MFFPVFFSILYLFHPILFYSSVYSLFYFLTLFINFILWSPLLFSFQNYYPFFPLLLLLYSVSFSLILYYYSICSLSISLHLFRSLYLILFSYLFCSCFCFLYTSSFWWGSMTLPVLCSSLPFCLFSFPIFSFCCFYASFLLFFVFFHFFCSLLASLIYATPSCSYYWLTDFSRLCLFTYLFIYLFIHYYYYFLSYLFCLYSFTTSAHWLEILSLILYTVSAVWHSTTCSIVSSFWLHMGHFVSSSSLG